MKTFDQLAKAAYAAYCKNFDGEDAKGRWVPEQRPWELLEAFEKAAWIAAAKQIAAEIAALH